MAKAYVGNHDELAAAVTNMNVDEIILTADIEMTAPIIIPPSKTELIFDGTHESATHRLTDMNSDDLYDTLAVQVTSSIQLTFRNMDITGRNYYGIPCIYDVVTSGVSVTYRNITYTGPQLVHNLAGTTHFDNVNITILASDASPAQEVGEVNRVDFAGNSIIRHDALADPTKAVFWFHYMGASFRVLEDAKLTVETTNYFMYNAILGLANPVPFEIESGASFTLNARQGISRSSIHPASSFLVDTNASFRYVQEESNDTHSLYINGSLTVNEGGSVYMQADYSDSSALINFPVSTAGNLSINSPKSFVLYKPSSAPITWFGTMARNFSIANVEQLNHWTAALAFPEAGTFADTPQNYWHNTNWDTFSMTGAVASGGNTANASNLPGAHIPSINFQYNTARVISAGSLTIDTDPIVDSGRPITGGTEPHAAIKISFTVDGYLYEFDGIEADADGRFECDPNMQIPIDTIVSISANTPFLIKKIEATVISAGEITITSAPVSIVFKTPPISINPVLLGRLNFDDPVVITADRVYLTRWKLSVSISGPLKAQSGEILENAVVFKDKDGTLWDIGDTPFVVLTGESRTDPVNVSWDEDEGILIRITGSVRSGAQYTTQLIWSLEVIQEP